MGEGVAPRPGLVLWDIDGTLLRAGDPDHIGGLREALSEVARRPVTFDGIELGGNIERRIAGDALLQAGVEPERVAELTAAAIERLGARYAAEVVDRSDRLLPGVHPTLEALSAAGWVHAALSGGARAVSETKLRTAGLAHLVTSGAYGDEADHRHELVDLALAASAWGGRRDEVVIVGDTPGDIACARSAGVAVVAVATGRWTLTDLADHRPDALLADLSDPASVGAALLGALG